MSKSVKVNALLNAIRQTMSILFPLITFPYVSRMLGNEAYGQYMFAVSIVSYFLLFASFGISNYSVREGARIRNSRDAIENFVSEMFTFSIVTTLLAYLFLFIILMCSKKMEGYRTLILIHSLCILLNCVGVDWINTIYEDFKYITIRYIVIQFFALFALFILIKSPADIFKYAVIVVLGSYGGNIVNVFYIKKYVRLKVNFRIHLKQHIVPLLLLFVNSLAVVIYVNSDITLLGYFVSDGEVGIYSFASRIYNMIKQFINAIMIVLVPRLAFLRDKDEKKYIYYIEQLWTYVFIFVIPIVVGVFMFSDSIISIVGGIAYAKGTGTLRILSFSLLFALLSSVYTNCILIINRKEARCLIATVSSALINVGLNLVFIPQFGIEGAAATTVIAEMVNMFIQSYYAKKEMNIKISLKRNNILSLIVGTVWIVMVCTMLNYWIEAASIWDDILKIVIGVIISGIGYMIFLYLFGNAMVIDLKNKLCRKFLDR